MGQVLGGTLEPWNPNVYYVKYFTQINCVFLKEPELWTRPLNPNPNYFSNITIAGSKPKPFLDHYLRPSKVENVYIKTANAKIRNLKINDELTIEPHV